MQKRNWKEYNQELIQRGSLTFLIDLEIFTDFFNTLNKDLEEIESFW